MTKEVSLLNLLSKLIILHLVYCLRLELANSFDLYFSSGKKKSSCFHIHSCSLTLFCISLSLIPYIFFNHYPTGHNIFCDPNSLYCKYWNFQPTKRFSQNICHQFISWCINQFYHLLIDQIFKPKEAHFNMLHSLE